MSEERKEFTVVRWAAENNTRFFYASGRWFAYCYDRAGRMLAKRGKSPIGAMAALFNAYRYDVPSLGY